MQIFFEDSPLTPSSVLLKKSVFGDSMLFTGSVGKYSGALREHLELTGQCLIFVDYSPNNMKVVDRYRDIIETVKDIRGNAWFKNTYVVLIFCMEYFILLLANDYLRDSELAQFLTQLIVPYELEDKNIPGLKFHTIEKQCKSVLQYLTDVNINPNAPLSCLYNQRRGGIKERYNLLLLSVVCCLYAMLSCKSKKRVTI